MGSSLFGVTCQLSKAMLSVPWRDQAHEAIHRFQNFEPNPAAMQTPLYLIGRDIHRQFAGYLLAQAQVDRVRDNAPVAHRDWIKPMSSDAMRIYSSGHVLLERIDRLVVSRLVAKAGPIMEACSEYADISGDLVPQAVEIDFDTRSIDVAAEHIAAQFLSHPGVEAVRQLRGVDNVDVKAVARRVRQYRQEITLEKSGPLRSALQGEVRTADPRHQQQLRLLGQLLYVSDSIYSVLQIAFEAFRYSRIPTINMDNVFHMGPARGGDFLEFDFRVQPNGDELFYIPGDVAFVDVEPGNGWSTKGPMRIVRTSTSFGRDGTTCAFLLHHLDDWLSAARFLYTRALV